MTSHDHVGLAWLPFGVAGIALLLYAWGVWAASRRGRSWPRGRSLLWLTGTLVCLAAVVGPLASLAAHSPAAHSSATHSFSAHMVSHLLLGMLGPVLLVRAAPVTLALRALTPTAARRLSRLMRSWPVGWACHPVVAAAVDLGGLWVLYTSGLYGLLAQPAVSVLVHVHLLVAGYLLATALVGVDPVRHRASYGSRAVVLVLFAAGHGILAKLIYARPPDGVSAAQAERGAMVMYYGGDAVHLIYLVLLGWAWYVSTGRRLGPRVEGPQPVR